MLISLIRTPLTKVVVVLVSAILGASCAASDPPPTSPLDEGESITQPTEQAPVPAIPSTAAPTSTPDRTPMPVDQERAVGGAIDALAEWLGIDATGIVVGAVTAEQWSDGCLGVHLPGVACDSAITPGYRIMLGLVSRPSPAYEVHASNSGAVAWAPHFDSQRVIESVDEATGRVALEPLAGSDEMGREHRVVPGTTLDGSLGDLQPGDAVNIAVTWPLTEGDVPVIVWLVPID